MWRSSLTAEQARAVKNGVLSGDLKMLYVAPEKYGLLVFFFECSMSLLRGV